MYSLRRAPFVLGRRLYSTSKTRTRHPIRTTLLVTSAISGGALLSLYSDARSCLKPPFKLVDTDAEPADAPQLLLALFRAYFVYGLISCDTIVDHAPEMFDALLKVPLLGTLVEGVVRHTFFGHFVGGDTVRATFPLLSSLRCQNKGVLLGYSVEVDAHEAAGAARHSEGSRANPATQPVHKRIVEEALRSVDVAAEFEETFGARDVVDRRTWLAVKLTALLPNADALRNLSLYLTRTRRALNPLVPFPGTPESSDLAVLHGRALEGSPLTAQDVHDLKELYDDLNRICARAKERGVRIVLDAEHSWYQPAIDAFGHALMERFNKRPDPRGLGFRWISGTSHAPAAELQPVVYVTYQAYLRRTPTHLARSLALARQHNYALGVKLVRGAYHPHELAAHSTADSIGISPDPYPPVHPSKPDTDACFDACAALLVRAIADDVQSAGTPRIGVLFGTHNWASSEAIVEQLVRHGLAHERAASTHDRKGSVTVPSGVAARLTFGQLYGMSDALTEYLVGRVRSSAPCVVKYVPYGALTEVMPYISRRAIENKSVLGGGGASRERKAAARLIWTRVFGGIGL